MPNPRCKTSSHPYLKSLCNNYYKQGPINADPPPAKPTQATAQGPKHRKATAGSYELNQRYPIPSNSTESSKHTRQGLNTYPPTLMLTDYTKGDVFAHLTSFKQTSESYIQMKRLSKRSPTLPLLLQSELFTIDN
ncbi:squamosa promoter-binding-like protein 1 [Dorcoceras hygrometricum]|uniref:Squamosa promoter-binding-like protein 1 n=1 Tax=Dorcoceras hygrometricum TaxID=472368 RepID=A0A2Z7D0Z7_9LAMI|nr:squamosa promoter-binding-like protein 1 [Dorcoceras hygrometricum]